jgi:hypothetical protein
MPTVVIAATRKVYSEPSTNPETAAEVAAEPVFSA